MRLSWVENEKVIDKTSILSMAKKGDEKTVKKFLSLLITASLVLTLTACGQSTTQTRTSVSTSTIGNDIEDCDFDDMIEGDEDCYGVDLESKKKKKSIKSTSKPTTKPKSTTKPKTNYKSKSKVKSKTSKK